MITQEEIARLLGISRATVARAINNSPSIKKETKDKVMEIVREYGYEKNYIGSSLASKITKTIYAFLIESKSEFYTNEIYSGLMAAHEEYKIYNFNLEIIYTKIDEREEQLEKLKEVLKDSHIDGLIITPLLAKEICEVLKPYSEKLEIVTLGTRLNENIHHIGPDHEKEGRIAGELMLNLLRADEKLLVIDNGDDKISAKRYLKGFISKVKASNLNLIGPLEGEGIETSISLLNKYLKDKEIRGIYINRYAHDILKEIDPKLLENKKVVVNGMSSTIKKLIEKKIITVAVMEEIYEEGYVTGKTIFDLLLKELPLKNKWQVSKSHIIFLENLV